MRSIGPIIGISLLFLLLHGCKKEEDATLPVITIISPGEGSAFALPDTLSITLRIAHHAPLERVSVMVVDAAGVPVSTAAGMLSPPTENELTFQLPVTSSNITSGQYRLLARCTAASGTSNLFRPIQLLAVPKHLRCIYFIVPSGNTTVVHRMDSLGNVSIASTWNMVPTGAACDHGSGTLVLAGGSLGDLVALAADGATPRWSRPNMSNTGEPYFTGLMVDGEGTAHVGTSDNKARSYHALTGTGTMTADLGIGRIEAIVPSGETLLCATRNPNGTQRWLRSHARYSGAPLGEHVLTFVPLALYPYQGHLHIYGNQGNEGRVEVRPLGSPTGWLARTWPAAITATEHLGGGTWLIGLANGELHRYQSANAGSIVLSSDLVVERMVREELSGTVLAVSGTDVFRINPGNGTRETVWQAPGTAAWALPLYNRW